MSWLFTSGGQSTGTSVSASVLPMNIQDRFPLGWTGLISLQSQGLAKSLLQHRSSKASIVQCSAFFTFQLSHPYMTTGKTIALTIWTFVSEVVSLLFNTLPRLVNFPSKEQVSVNFTAAVTIHGDFGAQQMMTCLQAFSQCAL